MVAFRTHRPIMLVHLFACLKMSSLPSKRLTKREIFGSSLEVPWALDSVTIKAGPSLLVHAGVVLSASYWSHPGEMPPDFVLC